MCVGRSATGKPCWRRRKPAQHALPSESEDAAFLAWLRDGHFTFLGARQYDVAAKTPSITGLGLLRDTLVPVFHTMAAGVAEMERLLAAPEALVVTKSALVSPVHRRVPMDVIAVKDKGKLYILLGLFTSKAYARAPEEIPLLCRKVADVKARSGFAPASHNGRVDSASDQCLCARTSCSR